MWFKDKETGKIFQISKQGEYWIFFESVDFFGDWPKPRTDVPELTIEEAKFLYSL